MEPVSGFQFPNREALAGREKKRRNNGHDAKKKREKREILEKNQSKKGQGSKENNSGQKEQEGKAQSEAGHPFPWESGEKIRKKRIVSPQGDDIIELSLDQIVKSK
jgi:hypothetical protein